jgi:hypothetical protein
METSDRRYWAIRSDKHNIPLLFAELQKGRLRQGWGYDATQDLRLLQTEIDRGGSWWAKMTPIQREALPNLRMFSKSNDSIKLNDIIIIPNLPEYGMFCIAEVSGEYIYDPLHLSKENDINDIEQDYGHILPVRLLAGKGVNKYAEGVPASIRSTLRTPMRMWNLDDYKEDIDKLLEYIKAGAGVALTTAFSGEARLEKAWAAALANAAEFLQSKLSKELNARFQAAEWEEPITLILGNLYPKPAANIRWVGGPVENGADVVVEIQNHLGGLPWLVIIQVKNYAGRLGPSPALEQLKTAYDHYSKEGRLLLLVVMTTADEASPEFLAGAQSLENELKIPVQAILKKQMMKLLSEGLLKKMSEPDIGSASTLES